MFLALAFLQFIGSVLMVFSCEGDCIAGITSALVGNYSRPVNIALSNIATSISSQIIQNSDNRTSPLTYLNPFIDEYNTRSHEYMVNTIFKTYFHGKCQNPDTGIEPAGCPNPDCPVVCGTSGSMVHFYPIFRYRAFNSTVNLWRDITDPKSPTYKKVEASILAAASAQRSKTRRQLRFMPRSTTKLTSNLGTSEAVHYDGLEKRGDALKTDLENLLHQFRLVLSVTCGGEEATGKTNGLPYCSWEDDFKQYMLTFP